MKITLEVSEDCEATESPWWAIVDPSQNMRAGLACAAGQITGPFFSRAEAEAQLKLTRYNYGKHANVWCFSGYHSRQYKEALRNAVNWGDNSEEVYRVASIYREGLRRMASGERLDCARLAEELLALPLLKARP